MLTVPRRFLCCSSFSCISVIVSFVCRCVKCFMAVVQSDWRPHKTSRGAGGSGAFFWAGGGGANAALQATMLSYEGFYRIRDSDFVLCMLLVSTGNLYRFYWSFCFDPLFFFRCFEKTAFRSVRSMLNSLILFSYFYSC